MKTINYGRQEITQDDIEAVVATLKSEYLTQGPLVPQFENEFAKFTGAKHAVAVNNATAALHLSYLALGTAKGKTVITTPISFVATSNAALYCGADVMFADIDPKTLCLDPNRVEDILKNSKDKKISVVAPVSFAGHPVNMEDFRFIADKYQVQLLEDACHAPGAKFKTKSGNWAKTGSSEFADLTVFSFHPVKHIATGEGGMITTNNDDYASALREWRSHGIVRDKSKLNADHGGWYYEMQSLGYNYRLPDINCALGISQLKRIDRNLKRRNEIAANYVNQLHDLPVVLPPVSSENVFNAHHLFVIQVEKRKELYEFLKANGIYSQIHYIPIHTQPYYVQKYGKQSFPLSEAYYQKTISLPMYHGMTDDEQNFVIKCIREFFRK